MAKAQAQRQQSHRTSPFGSTSTNQQTRQQIQNPSIPIPESPTADPASPTSSAETSATSDNPDHPTTSSNTAIRRSSRSKSTGPPTQTLTSTDKGKGRANIDIDEPTMATKETAPYSEKSSRPPAPLEFDESSIEIANEAIFPLAASSTSQQGSNSSLAAAGGTTAAAGVQTASHPGDGNEVSSTDGSTSDSDSACGSWLSADDTTSLNSSVLAYKYENGRRYHAYKEGKWIMPNDEAEQDRMDFYHHIFLLRLDGELFLAPIGESPQKILSLDIGTGTGIWAIDIADKYPSAEVIGTDLSPIQPTWVPPNLRFEVDDCEEPWVYVKSSFDLIHIRNLAGGIKDWRALFVRCFEHTAPGGYLEVQEVPSLFFTDDDSLPKDGGFSRMLSCFYAASEKAGLCFTNMDKLAGWMQEAGYIVEQKVYRLPVGMWPQDRKLKEIGKYMLANLVSSLESYCLALFTRYLNMSHAECKIVLDAAAKECKRKDIHMYLPVYFVYGRKPASSATA
ncbi:hypothetical protein Dda_6750 [Drechslerella dactyloides]|uniref:S-adenosyl-L-methionine-dependent methyltransferase n=1 Tax=Drechslerella dactyloides TaxID=74499 RepID=A0AAD6NGG9_DREDA|nr:hypothetical protein Dda_6750 [Drechslerella dactyloides]